MSLAPGTRLGAYEVIALIGAGGMGEVYRARDTRLNRNVAIKVLPELFAADADRLARFKREAQLLASLNHPHIAAIYGLEETSSGSALVLELVDGPTLADRIEKGPIPLDEALPIAKQIAEALEAAHELGIIHRDLKPANIKLTSDGSVKVLDFGLAKALDKSEVGRNFSSADLSLSPTITSPAMTMGGVILGTAAYMSPEQARGKNVDRRTDNWAFGCVLYEMLTGKAAFGGDNATDVIARVIERQPDFEKLPAETPPLLQRLLRRCLDKNPAQRCQHIGDVRIELGDLSYSPTAAPVTSSRSRAFGWIAALAMTIVVALTLVAIVALIGRRESDARTTLVQRQLTANPIEVDLFMQSIESGHPQALVTGPQNKKAVQLSPDGKWVLFQDFDVVRRRQNFVMRAPIGGGPSEPVLKGNSVRYDCAGGTCIFTQPRGRELIFRSFDANTGMGAEVGSLRMDFANSGFANWALSPDGSRAAVVNFGRQIQIVDFSGKPAKEIVLKDWTALEFIDWAARGDALYAVGYSVNGPRLNNTALLRVDLNGTVRVLRHKANHWHVYPTASPDGRHLAFALMILESNAWMVEGF